MELPSLEKETLQKEQDLAGRLGAQIQTHCLIYP